MIRALMLCLVASPALADTVVAARTIPPRTVLMAEDLKEIAQDIPGGIADAASIIGMEARVALYANRPISAASLRMPAVVERNQVITLIYDTGGMMISTDGRALDRAGPGEVIRVMNLGSRNTVSAKIGADGAAYVGR